MIAERLHEDESRLLLVTSSIARHSAAYWSPDAIATWVNAAYAGSQRPIRLNDDDEEEDGLAWDEIQEADIKTGIAGLVAGAFGGGFFGAAVDGTGGAIGGSLAEGLWQAFEE